MKKRIASLVSLIDSSEQREILGAGLEAALEAGKVLKELYYNSHEIRYKGRIDLVTEADVASEERVVSILREKTGIAIMAEESGISGNMEDNLLWIVDPLDGTTNFAHGFQVFAVSIALASIKEERLESELGIVYCPMQDELFWCVKGAGAFLEDRQLKVSSEDDISRSLIGTGFPYSIHEKIVEVMNVLKKVVLKAQGVRRAGAAAVDLAWVAAGRLDGFYEVGLKPWDTAAGALLVREAGGRISDFEGKQFHPQMYETLASNGLIHEELATAMIPI